MRTSLAAGWQGVGSHPLVPQALQPFVRALGTGLILAFLCASGTGAQTPAAPAPESPAAQPPAPTPDPLGRDTPRGSVLGFLDAAGKGEDEIAAQYLSTRLGKPATTLAHQLFVVLDVRLPARLTQVSDSPEGSRANPLKPDEEIIGAVPAADGSIDIVVERVIGPDKRPIWLFSTATLNAVPTLYSEVTFGLDERALPRVLTGRKIGGVRVLEWLVVLLGIPLFYFATVVLDRLLRPAVAGLWRTLFKDSTLFQRHLLPMPVRLLLVAVGTRWLLSALPLPLMLRQVGSNAAALLSIAAIVWLVILFNRQFEARVIRRFPAARGTAVQSVVRVARRGVDILVIFIGVLAVLRHFGVDPTPALAGLGVGGIAVALAAQKTLENVIAGASLILDQAVTTGDFLKMGEVSGTVDHIGLRSTRIRTLERTIVSVPNSQIASACLETLSARDKFLFHHVVGLRYETTREQLRAVVDGIRGALIGEPLTDEDSVRVRFLRLGASSLDVDVFAYLHAANLNHFLELQESLLFGITDVVAQAGTEIAFPSQTMYVDGPRARQSTGEEETRGDEVVAGRVLASRQQTGDQKIKRSGD
jgi:MscS family membrane protein